MDLRPDIVVLANGGHPFIEQNEHWGADEGLVVSSWDILDGKVSLQQLHDDLIASGHEPSPVSGRQELLERLVARHIDTVS